MGNGISRFELGGRLSINSIVMQLQLLSQRKEHHKMLQVAGPLTVTSTRLQ